MGAFRVDPAALLAVVDQMAAFNKRVEASLAQASALADRIGDSWSGQGAEAEYAAHQQWAQGAADMRDALDRLRITAEQAHANYLGAMQQNSRMWNT